MPDTISQSAEKPGCSPLQVSFCSFLISLGRTALEHIGEEGAPAKAGDLEMARQTIDLIGVIQEKTKGNLDSEEDALLTSMLYELRTRYVDKTRAHSA